MHVILQGVVGSTAYGLDHAGSDIDRLGFFAAPSADFWGLTPPVIKPLDSDVTKDPDVTMHELRKACLLLLRNNPSVSELLFLPAALYETRTVHGDELIANRSWFGCAPRIKSAYLGYAFDQFKRLEVRGDGSFSSDTRKRTAKHSRHLARLARQGLDYYRTGTLTVRVEDPQWYYDFGQQVADGQLDAAETLLRETEDAFDAATSPLPDEPNIAAVNAWLQDVRHRLWVEDIQRCQPRQEASHA